MPLSITRYTGESVNLYVGDVRVTVTLGKRRLDGGQILQIDAPESVRIYREEIDPRADEVLEVQK